jgi:S-adenosylmethionine:tRNA ribosyltransferase-isomerase
MLRFVKKCNGNTIFAASTRMKTQINIQDYTYILPDERIAVHPLAQRDESKLLVYQNGEIQHRSFPHILNLLPANSVLFFNDTKVIPARLLFEKDTGASIEIFLLQPESEELIQVAMQATGSCVWKCTIGNLKRWPDGLTLVKRVNNIEIRASLIDREKNLVAISWSPASLTFAEVIQSAGKTPLPPYIKRNAAEADRERYQTVYAQFDGAVAAPTAGLHFTPTLLDGLKKKGIQTDFLTLHVGAGTFQPVKTENALAHTMHEEQVVVTRKSIESLLSGRKIVAVGTTSVRVLESLYWYGVKLAGNPALPFSISQTDAYELPSRLTLESSLALVLQKLDRDEADLLTGKTSIYIYPGYEFKVCEVLITNFHQPGSTLILLVAAFVGSDWKRIYEVALEKDYRFLSYGDSSILFRS